MYDEYHVVDGNMRHVPRAMLYTGTDDHTKSRELWHAVMPRSLAGEYDWILHFRTGPEGGGTGTRLSIDSVWLEPVAPSNSTLLRVR